MPSEESDHGHAIAGMPETVILAAEAISRPIHSI
jgi:hypothetical protein